MEGDLVEDGPDVVSQYVSFSWENMLVSVNIGDDQWQLCDCLIGSTAILNVKSFEVVCTWHGPGGKLSICCSLSDLDHIMRFNTYKGQSSKWIYSQKATWSKTCKAGLCMFLLFVVVVLFVVGSHWLLLIVLV